MVSKGENYVFGQNLEDVAEFVGLQGTGHKPLPPAELAARWVDILRTGQSVIAQIPDAKMTEDVIPNRPRSVRLLAHHVFRIGEAFLESAEGGAEYAISHANVAPKDGTFMTGREVARYGEEVAARIDKWWAGLADKSGKQTMSTYYGPQPLHMVLERSTWHSAQHVRQLAHILEDRYGIKPAKNLKPEQLAGLPLPERLFE